MELVSGLQAYKALMKAFVEHNKVRFANAMFTTTTKPFIPSKLGRLDMNAWFLTKEYNIIKGASICDNISILKRYCWKRYLLFNILERVYAVCM
jgi:hypothetical protein